MCREHEPLSRHHTRHTSTTHATLPAHQPVRDVWGHRHRLQLRGVLVGVHHRPAILCGPAPGAPHQRNRDVGAPGRAVHQEVRMGTRSFVVWSPGWRRWRGASGVPRCAGGPLDCTPATATSPRTRLPPLSPAGPQHPTPRRVLVRQLGGVLHLRHLVWRGRAGRRRRGRARLGVPAPGLRVPAFQAAPGRRVGRELPEQPDQGEEVG